MSKPAPTKANPQPGDRNPVTRQIWALCTSEAECPVYPEGRWVEAHTPGKLAAAGYKRRCVLCGQRARTDRTRKLRTSDLPLDCGSTIRRANRRREPKNGSPSYAQLICGICEEGDDFVHCGHTEEELRRTMIFCRRCKPWAAVAFRPEHMAGPCEPTPQRDAVFATLRHVRDVMGGRVVLQPRREQTPFLLLAKNYVEQNPHASPEAGKSQWLHIRHLAIYFAHKEVGQIGEDQADEFEQSMLDAGALEEYTTDRIIQTLRVMLRYAVFSGWLPSNPLQNRKQKVRRDYRDYRIMTFGEERRLHAACVGELAHLRPMLLYVADAPAGWSDYLKLRTEDLDFNDNLIPGKRGLVEMTPRLREAMRSAYDQLGRRPGERLTSHTRDELSHAFYRACAAAGVEGLRLDMLRRAGGWRLRAAGHDYDYLTHRIGIGLSQLPKFLEVDRKLAAAEIASLDFVAFKHEQLGMPTQPQNDNGQKSREEKLRERRAAVVKDLLKRITVEVLRRKEEGAAIEDVKADEVARELSIGGMTGGNVMMQKLKYNGYSTTWPVLRRDIWDGGREWRGNSTKT
jgi:integrase